MQKALAILLCLFCLNGLAQIDTTFDYKKRFYKNETLITKNTINEGEKHGLWIEYLDKNWKESTKNKSKFFRLIEYKNGNPIGKVYDFYNSGKLQMVGKYKSLNPEIRQGTFIYFSKKGNRNSLSYYTSDSILNNNYYRNGNLMNSELYLRGRDMFNYSNSLWYFKNGNPKWLNYSDSKQDTSYYLSGRRNGSIDFQNVYSNGNFVSIDQNRKGKLVERRSRKVNSDTTLLEKFKNGQLVQTKIKIYNSDNSKYNNKYDIIKYYQGQVGGNSGVIILEKEKSTEYFVNGKKMTELEYNEYQLEYDSLIKKRLATHYYIKYSKDSTLVYEGLFKNVDQACGTYKEYHSNGLLKTRGWYDKKGRKTSAWYYYNKEGELIFSEFYKKGIKN